MGRVHSVSNVDGYCIIAQGLLDWFEVDLEFTKLFLNSTPKATQPNAPSRGLGPGVPSKCLVGGILFTGKNNFETEN